MASFPVQSALVLRREGASDESCSAWPATIAFARGPNGLFCNIGREGDAEHAQWLTFTTTHPTVSRKHVTLVATPDCSSAVATQYGQNGTGVCAPADGSRGVEGSAAAASESCACSRCRKALKGSLVARTLCVAFLSTRCGSPGP